MVVVDGNIGGFHHNIGDLEVSRRNSVVRIDDENRRTNRIHDDNLPVRGRGEPGHDVHELDVDLLDESSAIVENLKKFRCLS